MDNNWIRMEVLPSEIEQADKYAHIEMYNAKGNPIFQTDRALNDHVVGHIGQIKFHQWLDQMHIPHQYINNLKGLGDKGRDFIINDYTIDIKTAESDRPIDQIGNGYRMFIAKQQYDKHPNVNFFFNIQLDPNWQELYLIGGIHYKMVELFPIKQYNNNVNPCYQIPLVDLTPPYIWLKEIMIYHSNPSKEGTN